MSSPRSNASIAGDASAWPSIPRPVIRECGWQAPCHKKNPPRLLAQTMAGTGEGSLSAAHSGKVPAVYVSVRRLSQAACQYSNRLIRLAFFPDAPEVPAHPVRKCLKGVRGRHETPIKKAFGFGMRRRYALPARTQRTHAISDWRGKIGVIETRASMNHSAEIACSTKKTNNRKTLFPNQKQ